MTACMIRKLLINIIIFLYRISHYALHLIQLLPSLFPSLRISYSFLVFLSHFLILGANADWDFRISYMVKNPDGTDI